MGWLDDIGQWISNSVFENLNYLWDSIISIAYLIYYVLIVIPLDLFLSVLGYPIYYILWWFYEYVINTVEFLIKFIFSIFSWMPPSFAVIYGIGLLVVVIYFIYRFIMWLKSIIGGWL